MPEMDMAEHEAAYQEMMQAENESIAGILSQLEAHDIDQATRDDVRLKLETPGTIIVREEGFSITRRADNSFDLQWEEETRAA